MLFTKLSLAILHALTMTQRMVRSSTKVLFHCPQDVIDLLHNIVYLLILLNILQMSCHVYSLVIVRCL